MNYKFSVLGFDRIHTSTAAENAASVRVIEKIGLRYLKRDVYEEMKTLTSKDGTKIAFWRSGDGPPLLMVHGATADHSTTWRFVLPELEKRFTVYAMDRRGRGGSGNASKYELQREAEDIAAIVDSIGEPVSVIGHSYGALCAIEASLITTNIKKMILYEGIPLNGADLYQPGVLDKLDNLLEADDHEAMLYVLFKEIVEMPEDEIEVVRAQQDAWAIRLGNISTLPRELRTETDYRFEPRRFKNMQTPTLFLVGGDSPDREMKHANGVAGALPHGHVAVMPGQQHAAMYTAPEMFVNEVVRFLNELSRYMKRTWQPPVDTQEND